ncbi:c2H2-type domain-containing protein [Trichonephila clavipes]|nr:c2H2-type domain-containing protein [Trichonephila clavipes]
MEQLNLFRKIRGQEMSWATIVDFYARLREPAEIIGSLHDKFLGGPGKTILLDETFLTKRNYNKDRKTKFMTQELYSEYIADEGFEEWKKEEEIRTKSSFVKRGGAKKVTNKQFTYYMCHRSGISIIKSGRKRNEKIGGSVKCGKTCPAFMTSIRKQQEAIKITVEYQSVHAGLEMEVGKLNLHGDDRRNLAALLKAGVPSTKTS